jgi:hypothetical protein
MRPAPVPNEDETHLEDEARVADPLSDEFLNLLDTTAKVNREVFWELFRPIPSNLVRKWKDYDVSVRRRSVRLVTQRRVGVQVESPSGPRRPWCAAPPREGAACACAWIDCGSTARALSLPPFLSLSVSSRITGLFD